MIAAFGGIFSPENVESLVRNCLLVLGGFMAGYLAGYVVGYGVNRYILRRKVPVELQQLIRLICGIIVAILVALMVFTGGKGPGAGGPGGAASGEANTGEDKKPGDTPTDTKEKPKEPPPEVKKNTTEGLGEMPVTVRLLGGKNADGEKVYTFADDPAARKLAFPQLTKELEQRQKEAAEKKLKVRVILERPGSAEDKVPDRSATWSQLKKWLSDKGIPSSDP